MSLFSLNGRENIDLQSLKTRAQVEPALITIESFIVKERPQSKKRKDRACVLWWCSLTMKASIVIKAGSSFSLVL